MRAILLLTLTLLPAFSAASEGCTPNTSPAIDSGESAAGRYYVVPGFLDPFGEDDLFVYEESNGIDGLQRDDVWRDDTCGGEISGDTVLF
jgi:hypothetical protein